MLTRRSLGHWIHLLLRWSSRPRICRQPSRLQILLVFARSPPRPPQLGQALLEGTTPRGRGQGSHGPRQALPHQPRFCEKLARFFPLTELSCLTAYVSVQAFVAYPNRDSTPFRERYQIPEAETVVRGTLRYQGFPEFIKALVDTGFLNESPVDYLSKGSQGLPWAEVTAKALGASSSDEAALVAAIKEKTSFPSESEEERILSGLRWIGLFSKTETVTPRDNLLDTLCATLEAKMQYGAEERDMVMLQHKFEIENKDGSKETRTSTLLDYGVPGGVSSMARLVGVPCGVAVQLVLDGKISTRGVLAPYTLDIVKPLMEGVEAEGIKMVEKTL